MEDKIKEFNEEKYVEMLEDGTLYDYITNLQEQLHQASLDIQELIEKDIGCPSWCDKLTNSQEENKRLEKRNKEIYNGFIATQEELSDYATRNEKAQDLILNELSHLKANDEETWNKEFYDENNKLDYRKLCIELLNQVINLLDGGDE